MKAYKGFNKDLTCRGFQYEQGKSFETDEADLCSSGFHACERPLDVFNYYTPGQSVYHEVELEDVSDQREGDSKVCAKKIKVGAKLSIGELVKAQIEFTKEHCTTEHTDPERATAGEYGAATAGEYGAATAGEYGAATAGDRGAATAGYAGAATAGEYGAATSRGKSSVGENGLAVARGNGVRVKGGMGAVLVIAEEKDNSYELVGWKAVVVDGTAIKPDTWYKLKNGEFVEAND